MIAECVREQPVRPLGVSAVGDEAEELAKEAEEESEEHGEELGEHGSRLPIKIKDPKLPSPEEVKEHEMTHLPYRSWCVHCVRGKGKSMDHRKSGGEEHPRSTS